MEIKFRALTAVGEHKIIKYVIARSFFLCVYNDLPPTTPQVEADIRGDRRAQHDDPGAQILPSEISAVL